MRAAAAQSGDRISMYLRKMTLLTSKTKLYGTDF